MKKTVTGKLILSRETNPRERGVKIKMDTNCNKDYCGCEHVNDGISCDVKNCLYHEGDCHCTADQIAVGPSFDTSSTDTVCATFKPKKN